MSTTCKSVRIVRDFETHGHPYGISTSIGITVSVEWAAGRAEDALAVFDADVAAVRAQIIDGPLPEEPQ